MGGEIASILCAAASISQAVSGCHIPSVVAQLGRHISKCGMGGAKGPVLRQAWHVHPVCLLPGTNDPAGCMALPRRPPRVSCPIRSVSYTHLRAHETVLDLVC